MPTPKDARTGRQRAGLYPRRHGRLRPCLTPWRPLAWSSGVLGMPAVGTVQCEHMFDMAKCKYDWAAIQDYRRQGHTLKECAARFGFTVAAWYKAIERGTILTPPPTNRGGRYRYDWPSIQAYYDEGHTYRECRMRFGFAATSWDDAVKRGAIRTRPVRWPIERVISEAKSRTHIKKRLLADGLLESRCQECGLTEWRGKPLSIQIDHVNGINDDNRLENLRMLCPNCHSQTDTFGAKNKVVRRSRLV